MYDLLTGLDDIRMVNNESENIFMKNYSLVC